MQAFLRACSHARAAAENPETQRDVMETAVTTHRIATLPGDGIGPETSPRRVRVLDGRRRGLRLRARGSTSCPSAATPSTPRASRSRPPRARRARPPTRCCKGAVGGPAVGRAARCAPSRACSRCAPSSACYANVRPVRALDDAHLVAAAARAGRGHRPRDRARADRRPLLRRRASCDDDRAFDTCIYTRRRGRAHRPPRLRAGARRAAASCAQRRQGRTCSTSSKLWRARRRRGRRRLPRRRARAPARRLDGDEARRAAGRLRRDRDREHVRRHPLRPRRVRRRRHRPRAVGVAGRRPARPLRGRSTARRPTSPAPAAPTRPPRSSPLAMLLDELGETAAAARHRARRHHDCSTTARVTPDLGGTATTEEVGRRDRRAPWPRPLHEVTDHERDEPDPGPSRTRPRRRRPPYDGRDDRRRGRHPLSRGRGRRDLLGHPRRRDPPDLRRAGSTSSTPSSTCSCATSRAPATWRRATRASTGKVGVAWRRPGPGATNLVTPVADAFLDSTPLVVITGQVPTHLIGTDAFQEADTTGIFMPIVKHSYLVTRRRGHPARVQGGVPHRLAPGRPGPVLIDIPKDIAQRARSTSATPTTIDLPGYRPDAQGPPAADPGGGRRDRASHAQPVLYVGGGVVNAGAEQRAARRSPRRRRSRS